MRSVLLLCQDPGGMPAKKRASEPCTSPCAVQISVRWSKTIASSCYRLIAHDSVSSDPGWRACASTQGCVERCILMQEVLQAALEDCERTQSDHARHGPPPRTIVTYHS